MAALGLTGCDGGSGMTDEETSDPTMGDEDNTTSSSADTVLVTIDNVERSAWEIANVNGTSDLVGPTEENPRLTLEVGVRYHFDNNGGGPHPLGFQNADDEYLLRQESDQSGSLEDNEEIDFLDGDNRVAFTFTQTLADSVDSYRCTAHPSMEGEIISTN